MEKTKLQVKKIILEDLNFLLLSEYISVCYVCPEFLNLPSGSWCEIPSLRGWEGVQSSREKEEGGMPWWKSRRVGVMPSVLSVLS